MKKFLLLTMAASISFASFAQGNSNRNNGKYDKPRYEKHGRDRKDKDDDGRDGNWRNRDDRRDNNDWNNRDDRRDNNDWNTRNDNGNGGTPRRVQEAFNRDYPGAKSVSWMKDRGVWSARFKRGGLFGGKTTVRYRANGQRVTDNSSYANSW